MKQFSIVLNIVLLVAVGFLYYLHFADTKKIITAIPTVTPHTSIDSCASKGIVVAYVELDSLNNNVDFIRQRKKELESEQKKIINEYENSYHDLTAMRDNFVKKGKPTSQQEVDAFQEKLGLEQQKIEQTKQQKGQALAEKSARIMEDMQAKLKDFMSEYNKQKKFTLIFTTGTGLDYLLYKDSTLNITADIVKGLNSRMK